MSRLHTALAVTVALVVLIVGEVLLFNVAQHLIDKAVGR